MPPVRTLDLEVPTRPSRPLPRAPEKVAEMGKRYGVASSFDRLVTALTKI